MAVLVDVVLGEEHGELDLAGAGPAVLALALAACCFPRGHGDAGAVDRAVEHVRARGRRHRDQLPAGDGRGPLADRGGLRGAAGLGGPLHPLDGQLHAGQVFQQPGGSRERPGSRGRVVHRGQPWGQGGAGQAELGIAGREPVLARPAVVPGAAERDRAEHRIERLAPVISEFRLMPLAAGQPRAAVAGVGGQQLPQHAAAELQQPGAEHLLGGPQPALAAQRPGGFGGQPSYLGGRLRRESGIEPPFSPPEGGAPSPRALAGAAAGRASQIASFTCTICSLTATNCR